VREGMRITVELLGRMDRACQEHGCRLLVVLIPTKETVFAEHLLRDPRLHLGGEIAELVSYEAIGKGKLIAFLEAARIPYVDVLPTLRSHIAEGLYTRSDRDMHPGPNGYRVIGETVAEFVRQRLTESSSHR
jgi:SGNH hydrolase-like domain, acetyltransferase AlgX